MARVLPVMLSLKAEPITFSTEMKLSPAASPTVPPVARFSVTAAVAAE